MGLASVRGGWSWCVFFPDSLLSHGCKSKWCPFCLFHLLIWSCICFLMGCCWSRWTDEDVSFAFFPKSQVRNVEWCRCTRVVLILLWKIYFFWVFGLLLYSVVLDVLEFQEDTSFRASSNQDSQEEYNGRDVWPNSVSLRSLCHRGVFLLLKGASIWKMKCGDNNTQANDLHASRKQRFNQWSQQVNNKISSNTLVVSLAFIRTCQQALELAVLVGSLCLCSEMKHDYLRSQLRVICSESNWSSLDALDVLLSLLCFLDVFPNLQTLFAPVVIGCLVFQLYICVCMTSGFEQHFVENRGFVPFKNKVTDVFLL